MILMLTSCDIAPLLSMSTILKTFLMSLSVMGWPFTGLNLVQPASLIWSMIICNWLFMFFCCYCFFFIVPWTPWNQELCPSPLCTPTTAISPENVLEENIYLEKNIIIFILLLTNLRSFGSILILIKIKDKNIIKKKDSKKILKSEHHWPCGIVQCCYRWLPSSPPPLADTLHRLPLGQVSRTFPESVSFEKTQRRLAPDTPRG